MNSSPPVTAMTSSQMCVECGREFTWKRGPVLCESCNCECKSEGVVVEILHHERDDGESWSAHPVNCDLPEGRYRLIPIEGRE